MPSTRSTHARGLMQNSDRPCRLCAKTRARSPSVRFIFRLSYTIFAEWADLHPHYKRENWRAAAPVCARPPLIRPLTVIMNKRTLLRMALNWISHLGARAAAVRRRSVCVCVDWAAQMLLFQATPHWMRTGPSKYQICRKPCSTARPASSKLPRDCLKSRARKRVTKRRMILILLFRSVVNRCYDLLLSRPVLCHSLLSARFMQFLVARQCKCKPKRKLFLKVWTEIMQGGRNVYILFALFK